MAVYYTEAGATHCPSVLTITTQAECTTAGAFVGYSFKQVTSSTSRPPGCFWDQNGRSYLNTDSSGVATWTGVGGLCKEPWWREAGGSTCTTGPLTQDQCVTAGAFVGYSFKQVTSSTSRPPGCFWDQNGRSYYNTDPNGSNTWTGVGGICAGEIPYYTAAGATHCSSDQAVVGEDECALAGEKVGYPFKQVTSSTSRPPGCFWDQNGRSYLNTDSSGVATWTGVGGICRDV